MKKVLMINHVIANCGVYQFGKRIYDLVNASRNINYIYREIDTVSEYLTSIERIKPNIVIYNWHTNTMPWLSEDLIINNQTCKHFFYFHEERMRFAYDKYLFFGDYDVGNDRVPAEKSVLLPRPLLEYNGGYPINQIFTIGCFGFAFWNKGFHTLTTLINKTMQNVRIRYHMPKSHFGDPKDIQGRGVITKCQGIMSKQNKLFISRDFLDDAGVLSFLAENDINVFNYGENGEGLSSVIDYALSVERPIAITKSLMFRHIYKPEIALNLHPIREIHALGIEPLKEFYKKWSINKFKQQFDEVMENE
jgi:hypothetical protein